jgi:hypothetical protein
LVGLYFKLFSRRADDLANLTESKPEISWPRSPTPLRRERGTQLDKPTVKSTKLQSNI